MKLTFRLGKYRFVTYIAKTEKVKGVNSKIDDEHHILMLDFDGVEDLNDLLQDLRRIQYKYKLPDIYVVESSPNNYQAYCFKKLTWREAIHIATDCKYIDMNYVKLSLIRGYFTLRIDATDTRPAPKLVAVLQSRYPADVKPEDLKEFVIYEAKVKEVKKNA